MANSGGKNRADVFASNAAHTGLVKVTALTMVATATPITVATDAMLKANKNFSATVTPVRKNKGYEVTLDQDKYSGSVLQAANIYVQGEQPAEEYYNDGVAADSPTAGGTVPNDAVMIYYLGLDPDDVTKMMCLALFGNFKEGSGAITQKHLETIKPKIDFVSKKTTAAMVIPAVAFDAALVTGAEKTITAGTEFLLFNLAAV